MAFTRKSYLKVVQNRVGGGWSGPLFDNVQKLGFFLLNDFPSDYEPEKLKIPCVRISLYLNLKWQGLPGSAVPAGSLSPSQQATGLWLLRFGSKINSQDVTGKGMKKKKNKIIL